VSNAVDMTRQLLRGSDPIPVEMTTGTARDPIGRATLRGILAIPRNQTGPGLRPQRGWRLAAVVATGAVVLLAAGLILVPHGGGGGSAYAMTPPLLRYRTTAAAPSGQELLRQLAVLAERQSPKPAGRYDFVKTRGWYLDFRVASGSATGQLDPTFRQQWIAPEGSGRLEETRGDRTTLNDNVSSSSLAGPQEWPTDPSALRAELAKSHPNYGTFEWFTALGDVWNVQVVSPRLQAGLLRMLANERQLTNAGTVTDRIGRTGVAVSTESSNSGLNTRYTLIFDPKTGMLLDFEQVLLEAGKLPVKVPATSNYTVWITTGHVNSIGDLTPAS
jgi:hypothetical protein